ncbi:TPA: hypothetical protein DEO28_04215 [Candidatus Dependentiae bacterium]|nr:hypothetical protein [Candidatus Dependentiae bacterium]
MVYKKALDNLTFWFKESKKELIIPYIYPYFYYSTLSLFFNFILSKILPAQTSHKASSGKLWAKGAQNTAPLDPQTKEKYLWNL